MRPGRVLARRNRMPDPLIYLTWSVRVWELAVVMVGCVLDGSEALIVEYQRLRKIGGALLGKTRGKG